MTEAVVHGRRVDSNRLALLGLAAAAVLYLLPLLSDAVPSWLMHVATSVMTAVIFGEMWQELVGPRVRRYSGVVSARKELRKLFSSVSQPPIDEVLDILEPIEQGSGLDTPKVLADRFFLGMIDRETFDRDMRRVLGVKIWP